MCILMVIFQVITINYSYLALIINFSPHFYFFLMVNYWGGGMIVQATPPPEILGGYIPPSLPGSTPMFKIVLIKPTFLKLLQRVKYRLISLFSMTLINAVPIPPSGCVLFQELISTK